MKEHPTFSPHIIQWEISHYITSLIAFIYEEETERVDIMSWTFTNFLTFANKLKKDIF